LRGSLRRPPGAKNVIVDSFEDVLLDDWDMFVRRGVVERLNSEDGNSLLHACFVMHGSEQRDDFAIRAQILDQGTQLPVDLVQRSFRQVQAHEAARRLLENLAAISMTAFVSVVILVLYYFNFGIKGKLESVLRITYDVESGALDKLESEIGRLFAESKLINRVLDFGEGAETNVYVVKPGASTDAEEVENALRAVPGIQQVSMYQSDQHAPF
jgi:hypothetical protein